jgi:hypothetical protein
MPIAHRLVSYALAAALAAPALATDLTIVSTVTAGKGKSTTSTQYLSEDKVRTSDAESDIIVDYATGSMTFVEHKKKRYWTTTPQEMAAQFQEMAAMLEANPIMKRMFGDASQAEVEKLGTERTIAGHRCTDYRVTLGQAYRFEICAAADVEAPISYHAARRMSYAMLGPMAGKLNSLLDEMQKIGGMPLRTQFSMSLMGQSVETVTEATEVKEGTLSADTFQVDPSYQETKSPWAK